MTCIDQLRRLFYSKLFQIGNILIALFFFQVSFFSFETGHTGISPENGLTQIENGLTDFILVDISLSFTLPLWLLFAFRSVQVRNPKCLKATRIILIIEVCLHILQSGLYGQSVYW